MIIKKKNSELTISDFQNYPIWTWDDDDDDLVVPVIDKNKIIENDAIFVKALFVFNNGMNFGGILSLRVSDSEVYLIELQISKNSLICIPFQPLLANQKKQNIEILSQKMSLTKEEIFPISFETSIKLENGEKIRGKINY